MTGKRNKYSNFSNVEKMQNTIIPEEFPEGAFGSPINKDEAVEGKSTPWEQSQHSESPYEYPNGGLQRQVPGAYPVKVKDRETD